MPAARTPVVPGLFAETADGARLLGSRCATCGTPYFPRVDRCRKPDCERSRIEEHAFGPRGVLWSRAIQNYPPPEPALFDEPYVPYAIGVVDLDEGLRVVGRIDCADPEAVAAGAPVELVIGPIGHDADGGEQVSWKFRPL
ncbi:MAG: Zn-ribbon domain-containing OB-fold protein [Myxococcota bacterium]